MAAISAWVEQAKQHLYTNYQDGINKLDQAMTNVQDQIALKYDPEGLSRGSIVAVDYEEMMVWELNGKNLTVQRGWNGSAGIAHDLAAMLYIKPKFSAWRIFNAINDTLRDLSSPMSGLFAVDEIQLTASPSRVGYDLVGAPATILGVAGVRWVDLISLDLPPIKSFDLVTTENLTVFPSGRGIVLYEDAAPGRPILVTLKMPYTLATTGGTQEATGLHAEAWDLPPLGAALRLVPPRDIKRAFTEAQGEPRRAEEVPPGSSRQATAGIAVIYQQRVQAEAVRLAQRYPVWLP